MSLTVGEESRRGRLCGAKKIIGTDSASHSSSPLGPEIGSNRVVGVERDSLRRTRVIVVAAPFSIVESGRVVARFVEAAIEVPDGQGDETGEAKDYDNAHL